MELKTVACKDGVYSWRCKTDYEFKLYEYHYALRMGWFISGFMILLGILLSFVEEYFLALVFTCAIIFLIVLTVSRYVLNRPGFETIPFQMTEDFVRFREGRGCTFVSFKSVVRIETEGNRIDLYTKHSKYPVYIPEEDFEPLRDLIIRNVEEKSRRYS